MQDFLFYTHSGVRWLVVLVTVVAFVYLLYRWRTGQPYDARTHRLMTVFSSLIGVQWVLGLVLIVVMGAYTVYQIEHAVTMTAVVAAAHLYLPFKKRGDMGRYRASLMVIVGVVVLVYIGVARLPQGWGI